jgi:probable addiction module antidote protein
VANIQAELKRMMKKRKVTFYGMAKAIGVDRGSLYKSLKDGSNLELNTMIKVLSHLGYEIRFVKSKSNLSRK